MFYDKIYNRIFIWYTISLIMSINKIILLHLLFILLLFIIYII